ncbi:MAG: glycosyltransferase, partial [Caldilineaceae bacterium]
LLVGGGEGMGPVGAIARAVAARLAADGREAQLVVVCGRNESLRRELAAVAWPLPVRVEGFVRNMPEWMAASDCVVTKAGPGTIAEALISGLPILLTGFIPGQEEGNVPFVVDNGVGAYSEKPEEIARLLSRWFGPERAHLEEMGHKARSMGRPQATFEIVDEIVALLDK